MSISDPFSSIILNSAVNDLERCNNGCKEKNI